MPDQISRTLYQGRDRAPARAFLHAIGLKAEDIDKPFVGVSNVWTETMPCNFGLRELAVPVKAGIRAAGANVDENEATEFACFAEAVTAVEHCHDFVVIDTPPHDSYLMRLAHSIADTLVTPLNDSFLDFDVLATLDPVTLTVTGVSHYGELVRETRRLTLAHKALQCPSSAPLDGRRHVGQRNQRAELATAADELERRDVVLEAVVVRGQRRRASSGGGIRSGSPTRGLFG